MIDYISFIIITNNDLKDKLENQIKSIYIQKIKNFEIIICGFLEECKISMLLNKYDKVHYLEAKDSSENGMLGAMRNKACRESKYENIVISDDDMLFSFDWYKNLITNNSNFDILTTCVKTPDGTRFWDKCCYLSPVNGHKILNYEENDDFLYMSGGQSWIMKSYVFDKVKWNEDIKIYNMNNYGSYLEGKQNEDTDFSERCRPLFSIKHDPNTVVYHDDPSYTSFGRIVRRRLFGNDHKWCEKIFFPEKVMSEIALVLLKNGLHAESFDILRKSIIDGNFSKNLLIQFESIFGDKLQNSEFSFYNDHYIKSINSIKNI